MSDCIVEYNQVHSFRGILLIVLHHLFVNDFSYILNIRAWLVHRRRFVQKVSSVVIRVFPLKVGEKVVFNYWRLPRFVLVIAFEV